jgi:hypothetical protein
LVGWARLGQPEAAERTGASSQVPLPQPEPAERIGAGTQPAAHQATGRQCQSTRQFLSLSSPSASPRSWPSLTVFGGCQGIFPALTTPKNCCTTMRDRGDAEAQSVPKNPNSDHQADRPPERAAHHPRQSSRTVSGNLGQASNPPTSRQGWHRPHTVLIRRRTLRRHRQNRHLTSKYATSPGAPRPTGSPHHSAGGVPY